MRTPGQIRVRDTKALAEVAAWHVAQTGGIQVLAARKLQIDPSFLSKILAGRRPTIGWRVAEALNQSLPPALERRYLAALHDVARIEAYGKAIDEEGLQRNGDKEPKPNRLRLDEGIRVARALDKAGWGKSVSRLWRYAQKQLGDRPETDGYFLHLQIVAVESIAGICVWNGITPEDLQRAGVLRALAHQVLRVQRAALDLRRSAPA